MKQIIEKLSEIQMTDSAVNLIHNQSNRFRQIVRIIAKAEAVAKTNCIETIDENILKEIIKNEKRQDTENNKRAEYILDR